MEDKSERILLQLHELLGDISDIQAQLSSLHERAGELLLQFSDNATYDLRAHEAEARPESLERNVLRSMAEIRTSESKLIEAEDHFKNVLAMDAGNADAVKNLVALLRLSGRKEEALAACLNALTSAAAKDVRLQTSPVAKSVTRCVEGVKEGAGRAANPPKEREPFIVADDNGRIPSGSFKNKIFMLGDSRTGTMSFNHFMLALGLKAIHYYVVESNQIKVLHRHEDNWKNRRWEKVKEFIDVSGYEAFSDYPTRLFYKELSAAYPDAYFILSTRSSVEKWQRSLVTYLESRNIVFDLEECTKTYIEDNQRIREHFAKSGNRFIEICIEDDQKELSERLKNFLGIKSDILMGWSHRLAS